MGLTNKQRRFCDEYLIDCNATQAAIRAGYSAKTAYAAGAENLRKPQIKNYIEARIKELESAKVADAEEVMAYLSAVLRGESRAEVVVTEGQGEGFSRARTMVKGPDEKDRLKAAELLGKRFGIYTDKAMISMIQPVIGGEDDLED